MRWRPLPAFAAIDFLSCLLVVFVAFCLLAAGAALKALAIFLLLVQLSAATVSRDLLQTMENLLRRQAIRRI